MAPAPGDGGWRRVVPSPRPYSIVEAPVIRQLVAAGVIVIGSLPVLGLNIARVARREWKRHQLTSWR